MKKPQNLTRWQRFGRDHPVRAGVSSGLAVAVLALVNFRSIRVAAGVAVVMSALYSISACRFGPIGRYVRRWYDDEGRLRHTRVSDS